jgi:hypothetical protein
VLLAFDYTTGRDAVASDAAGEGDEGIAASLPTAAQLSTTYPAGYSYSPGSGLLSSKASWKALGFAGLDGAYGATDATITFNNQYPFDYDNSDGVSPGAYDFESVAAHELGHALGFLSTVDAIDTGLPGGYPLGVLDLYRFAEGGAADPSTAGEFTTFARDQRPGVEANFDDIDAEERMSTGWLTGDGWQASHWKEKSLNPGGYIGIMNPAIAKGLTTPITNADLRALDLMGWEIVSGSVVTTTTTSTTLPPPICESAPAVGCRLAEAGRASIQVRDNPDDTRDSLKWKWARGGATLLGDFKDPVNGSANYQLCMYDASANPQPLLDAVILPGGTCDARPCWKPSGTTGYSMSNRTGSPHGVVKVKLKASETGRAQVKVTASGAYLDTPGLPLTLPVTVQLLVQDSVSTECWQTTYTAQRRNEPTQFNARGP